MPAFFLLPCRADKKEPACHADALSPQNRCARTASGGRRCKRLLHQAVPVAVQVQDAPAGKAQDMPEELPQRQWME